MPNEKHSLNWTIRKQSLIKIAQENQTIFKRLQNRKTSYNAERFCEEYKKKQKILKNICRHPFVLEKNHNKSFVF